MRKRPRSPARELCPRPLLPLFRFEKGALALTLVASQALAQSRPYYDSTLLRVVRAHCQALDNRLPGLECLDPSVSARSSTSGNRSTTYEKTFRKNCSSKEGTFFLTFERHSSSRFRRTASLCRAVPAAACNSSRRCPAPSAHNDYRSYGPSYLCLRSCSACCRSSAHCTTCS